MDDNCDLGTARGTEERPHGVSKAKLTDINLKPKLSIFYRPDRNVAMVPLEASFPIEAAKIFCDRIRSSINDSDNRSYVITGGDKVAYKMIFSWIMECVQSQNIEKFPEIPEPDHDAFTPTINVIIAGERLGVPAGSLSYHLKKRLNGCARKRLMPFAQVRALYNIYSEEYDLGLKDVACASIFNAWWDARLDESVNPEMMEELFDMRDDIHELDLDLHEACKTREEEVRKKWAEKKAKKAAAETGIDECGNAGATAGDNSWDTLAGGSVQANIQTNGDWENEKFNTITDNNEDCTKPQKLLHNDWNNTGGEYEMQKNWADEMNEPYTEPPHSVPTPQW